MTITSNESSTRSHHDDASELLRSLGGQKSRMVHYLVIPGVPASKARPRFVSGGHSYKSQESRAAEELTAWHLRRSFKEPLEGRLAVGCLFYRPTFQRIDVDNMLKHVLDAATGICWKDDSQITALIGRKRVDPVDPRTVFLICPDTASDFSTTDERLRRCEVCGELTSAPEQPGVRYCGRECREKARGYSLRDLVPCPVCGTEFRRRTSAQKLCSETCRRRWLVGRAQLNNRINRCVDCGSPTARKSAQRCRECWRKSKRLTAPTIEIEELP